MSTHLLLERDRVIDKKIALRETPVYICQEKGVIHLGNEIKGIGLIEIRYEEKSHVFELLNPGIKPHFKGHRIRLKRLNHDDVIVTPIFSLRYLEASLTSELPKAEEADRPSITCIKGNQHGLSIMLNPEILYIGRRLLTGMRALEIEDRFVSQYHCIIELRDDCYWVQDLKSKNGTFVNGRKVSHMRLKDQDVIRVGATELRFMDRLHKDPPLLASREGVTYLIFGVALFVTMALLILVLLYILR